MKLNILNYCYFICGTQLAMGPFLFSFILECVAMHIVCMLFHFRSIWEIIYKWKRMYNNLYWNNIVFGTNFRQGFCWLHGQFIRGRRHYNNIQMKTENSSVHFTHTLFARPKFEMRTTYDDVICIWNFGTFSQDGINFFRFTLHANDFYWFASAIHIQMSFQIQISGGSLVGSKSLVLHYNIWLL